jgi:hypothetical protein
MGHTITDETDVREYQKVSKPKIIITPPPKTPLFGVLQDVLKRGK